MICGFGKVEPFNSTILRIQLICCAWTAGCWPPYFSKITQSYVQGWLLGSTNTVACVLWLVCVGATFYNLQRARKHRSGPACRWLGTTPLYAYFYNYTDTRTLIFWHFQTPFCNYSICSSQFTVEQTLSRHLCFCRLMHIESRRSGTQTHELYFLTPKLPPLSYSYSSPKWCGPPILPQSHWEINGVKTGNDKGAVTLCVIGMPGHPRQRTVCKRWSPGEHPSYLSDRGVHKRASSYLTNTYPVPCSARPWTCCQSVAVSKTTSSHPCGIIIYDGDVFIAQK